MSPVDWLRQLLTRVRQGVHDLLRSRVVWWSRDRTALTRGSSSHSFELCLVVGIEHYTQNSRRLPVRSRRDVFAVLQLEAADNSDQLVYVGPADSDHRDVQVYRIGGGFDWASTLSLFCVPESRVLSRALAADEAFEVCRFDQRYFVTADGRCQRAGGLIQSAELFRLACGAPTLTIIQLDEQSIPPMLLRGLRRFNLTDWLSSVSPELYRRVRSGWQPVAKLVAILGLGYLVVVSVYLSGMLMYRQHQIDKLGADVDQLLVAQRQVAAGEREINALIGALNAKKQGWTSWAFVKAVWDKGGRVYGVSINDEGIVLRGVVPDATQLLRDVSSLPGYQGAQFDAPVTQVPEGQQFVIAVRPPRGTANAK